MRSVLASASSSQNRSVYRQVPVVLHYLLSFFTTLPEPGGTALERTAWRRLRRHPPWQCGSSGAAPGATW